MRNYNVVQGSEEYKALTTLWFSDKVLMPWYAWCNKNGATVHWIEDQAGKRIQHISFESQAVVGKILLMGGV